jgi:hypothetical protein
MYDSSYFFERELMCQQLHDKIEEESLDELTQPPTGFSDIARAYLTGGISGVKKILHEVVQFYYDTILERQRQYEDCYDPLEKKQLSESCQEAQNFLELEIDGYRKDNLLPKWFILDKVVLHDVQGL